MRFRCSCRRFRPCILQWLHLLNRAAKRGRRVCQAHHLLDQRSGQSPIRTRHNRPHQRAPGPPFDRLPDRGSCSHRSCHRNRRLSLNPRQCRRQWRSRWRRRRASRPGSRSQSKCWESQAARPHLCRDRCMDQRGRKCRRHRCRTDSFRRSQLRNLDRCRIRCQRWPRHRSCRPHRLYSLRSLCSRKSRRCLWRGRRSCTHFHRCSHPLHLRHKRHLHRCRSSKLHRSLRCRLRRGRWHKYKACCPSQPVGRCCSCRLLSRCNLWIRHHRTRHLDRCL